MRSATRESIRVSGAFVAGAQTTIEPDLVRNWVGETACNDFGMTLKRSSRLLVAHGCTLKQALL
jgi:hypothetical protein